jgi:hypothetical protein
MAMERRARTIPQPPGGRRWGVDGRRRRLLTTGAAVAIGALVGRASPARAGPLGCGTPPREPPPFAPPDPAVPWSASPGPTAVELARVGDAYRYQVAGRAETIRGMGYNPPPTGLGPEPWRPRPARDFALMAAAGVNTVIGWSPAVQDGRALDLAEEAGLGVALPFDVDFTADVADAATRRAFADAVLGWVSQYREHPAVRMWAVGNEVLQRAVPPAWCDAAPSASQAAWAGAWASLLVEVADLIHARDPHHPVLYREAEDAYAPWLARALAGRPADRRWLIYGVNAYTPRLAEILDDWPKRGIPTSLVVSEYAPLDAPRGARAGRFREIWGAIRARPGYVIGGAAYVWSTDGPEAVDRAFGLVDERGEPVDDALDAIAALYHEEAQLGTLIQPGSPNHASWTARHAAATAPGGSARAGRAGIDGRPGVGPVLS